MEVFSRGFWIGFLTFVTFQIGFFIIQWFVGIQSNFWREFGWDYLIPAIGLIIVETVYFRFNPINWNLIVAGIAFLFSLLLVFLANVWMRSLG
jgi:hypothetical protein